MRRRPPRSTRTDTLVPYTTLFRSIQAAAAGERIGFDRVFPWRQSTGARAAGQEQRGGKRGEHESQPASRAGAWHGHGSGFRRVEVVARALEQPRERSEEHTSELQSLMRISYADFCLKKKNKK